MNKAYSRRKFMAGLSTSSLAIAASPVLPGLGNVLIQNKEKLAILGGTAIREKGRIGPAWPYVDDQMVNAIVKTTRSGIWSRIQSATGNVPTFEKEFARQIGVGYSVGTGSGTQALSTCVEALGIGPGDEVITSPYTDMGTISSILTSRALPVMVDLDLTSFQLDPEEVAKKINTNTKAIMPVHIMGVPANMERIMELARKNGLKVIEDSCQAPFARYQGKAIGTIGDLGCFSFQASKAIACGEGGAVVGNDQALMEQCYTVQNRGASRKGRNETIGPKYRMNEFEGAILMGQLPGAKDRFLKRNENAEYLIAQLAGIPGLTPQKKYPGTESSSYYHFAMSYNKEHFNGADRSLFLKALNAEGIPMGSYIKNGLHKEPWIQHVLGLDEYQTMYTKERREAYTNSLDFPNCDKICNETLISFWGSGMLLGTRREMDEIVAGITKVYENRDSLNKIKNT
ncbi:DegT/DnrJ/EryC1/StrS family aminotransferase [Cyclobacterium amurskyense]|uniref:DegT/DnrJ/EryC1/StrS family aminotransferase n=1 Tax=Cyclobacterium amurskyense TaxID=320787 RepID=UPI0030DAD274